MKLNFVMIALLFAFIGSGFCARGLNSGLPDEITIKALVIGTGTHFEITDSDYLNITLDSTETISIILQSVPEMITMYIQPSAEAASTIITITGLQPLTKYYKYEDNHHNMVEFTTNEAGTYTYTQNLSQEHFVFFQTTPSTLYIKDDFSGGNCVLIGNWDAISKTCTMTTNLDDPVHKTIQIDDSGITLDGAEHTIYSNPQSAGIYSEGTTGVTIKNVKTENASAGITLFNCSNSTITGNTLSNGYIGIQIGGTSSTNNKVTENIANSNTFGIYIVYSNNTQVKYNTFSDNAYGILIIQANDNTIINNNFINSSSYQALVSNSTGNQFFDSELGGNHWSDWTSPDNDNDGIVDNPYVFYGGQDDLPFVYMIIYGESQDVTPPEITINIPQPNAVYPVGLILDFNAEDLESGLDYVKGTLTDMDGQSIVVYDGYVISEAGAYTLTVTAKDEEGNIATSQPVQFVVNDTNGGFATGGGWFKPDAESSLSSDGTANFGFVARYLKGKATGNLEFQYKDTNSINLKSKAISWLAVSNTSAEFQGVGTINGTGLYTFRVRATDSTATGIGIDSFSIRIWQGTNTAAEPLYTAKNGLQGGNIAVHKRSMLIFI